MPLSTKQFVSAASNNATVVKASQSWLHGIIANNLNAAQRYLKFYDKATAPAPGSDTPKIVVPLPAGVGNHAVITFPKPIEFPTGLSYALVTGIGNTDNTSVSANETNATIFYE